MTTPCVSSKGWRPHNTVTRPFTLYTPPHTMHARHPPPHTRTPTHHTQTHTHTHTAIVRHLRVVRRNLVQKLVRDLGEVAARTTVLCQGQLAPRDEAVNDRHCRGVAASKLESYFTRRPL